jgi:hypothetical protein
MSYLWKLRKKVELQVTHVTLLLLYHNDPFWMPASVHGAGGKLPAGRKTLPLLPIDNFLNTCLQCRQ